MNKNRKQEKYKNIIHVTYLNKEYTVIELNTGIIFMIDKIDYDNIIKNIANKFYFCNNYIGTRINGKFNYLHNLVMNYKPIREKHNGAKMTIDHINRIGTDNRKENLKLKSQSDQNRNQNKIKRKVKLPDGCGIDPNDIPKYIHFCKEKGKSGKIFNSFEVYIKGNNGKIKFRKSVTKEEGSSLKLKLHLAKKLLAKYIKNDPSMKNHSINGELSPEGKITERSYYIILEKAGYIAPFFDKFKLPKYMLFDSSKKCFRIRGHLHNKKGKKTNRNNIYDSYIQGINFLKKLDRSHDETYIELKEYWTEYELHKNDDKYDFKCPSYTHEKDNGERYGIDKSHPKLKKLGITHVLNTSRDKNKNKAEKYKELLDKMEILNKYNDKEIIEYEFKQFNKTEDDEKYKCPKGAWYTVSKTHGASFEMGKGCVIYTKNGKEITTGDLGLKSISTTSSGYVSKDKKYEMLQDLLKVIRKNKNKNKQTIKKEIDKIKKIHDKQIKDIKKQKSDNHYDRPDIGTSYSRPKNGNSCFYIMPNYKKMKELGIKKKISTIANKYMSDDVKYQMFLEQLKIIDNNNNKTVIEQELKNIKEKYKLLIPKKN